jgi:[ribosomal protein S5]-alanine N-acetyltransferase
MNGPVPPEFDAVGERVAIRRPAALDCDEFIRLMRASESLHHPWLAPPRTADEFKGYLCGRQSPTEAGFLICCRESGAIAGVININCIVRGYFQSGYLGYYVGAPYAGQGYMTEGMRLVTAYAFGQMKMHRLEANIQPDNMPSIALVRKCGFRREGFSPRYLQVLGQWRDHERWALLADESSMPEFATDC